MPGVVPHLPHGQTTGSAHSIHPTRGRETTTSLSPLLFPSAARQSAVVRSIRASDIGPNVTLLSGGCHLAFGPMQPDIRPNVTRRNASRHERKPAKFKISASTNILSRPRGAKVAKYPYLCHAARPGSPIQRPHESCPALTFTLHTYPHSPARPAPACP